IHAARVKRGMRRPDASSEPMRKLRQAFMSGKEEPLVAVFDEHPELAQMRPESGVSMLHQSAGRGALKLAKWLIDHGADVDGTSREGTPLDFAASGHGSEEWLFDNEKFQRTAQFLIDQGAHLSPRSAATLGRWDYLEKCSKEELEGKDLLEAAVKGNQLDTLR